VEQLVCQGAFIYYFNAGDSWFCMVEGRISRLCYVEVVVILEVELVFGSFKWATDGNPILK